MNANQGHKLKEEEENILKKVLEEEKIDPKIPTLIIAECVMVYLDPEAVEPIIQFFGETFKTVAFMDYEIFNSKSNFGKMLLSNFAKRGLNLDAIENFESLPQIEGMFKKNGFARCQVENMNTIFMKFLPQPEVQRVRKLEWLDEWEELRLMQDHYFIAIGVKNEGEGLGWFDGLGFDTLKK